MPDNPDVWQKVIARETAALTNRPLFFFRLLDAAGGRPETNGFHAGVKRTMAEETSAALRDIGGQFQSFLAICRKPKRSSSFR